MQVPVEIAFHNMESSPWAEQEIRKRIKKLEKIYDRLISCRVRVDQRTKTGASFRRPICITRSTKRSASPRTSLAS